MNENERYERLNDYVDGVLSAAEAREVEAELERDPAFREEECALRALLCEAQRLPKTAVPRCDLWQGIESRLCERVCGRTESARTAMRRLYRASLAAAAAVLIFAAGVWYAQDGQIALAPVVTKNSTQPNTVKTPEDAAPGGDAANLAPEVELASYEQVELEYASVREALRARLDEARPRLAPETVRVVDDSLKTIDDAIKEIENALASDPGNHGLIRSLVAVYDQEVDLLRQVSRVSELTGEDNA